MELSGLPPQSHTYSTIQSTASKTTHLHFSFAKSSAHKPKLPNCSALISKYTKLEIDQQRKVRIFLGALVITALAIMILGLVSQSMPALVGIAVLVVIGILLLRKILQSAELQKKYHGYSVGLQSTNFYESIKNFPPEKLKEKDLLLFAEIAYLNIRYSEIAKEMHKMREAMLKEDVGLRDFKKYMKNPEYVAHTLAQLPSNAQTHPKRDVDLSFLHCDRISEDFPTLKAHCQRLADVQYEAYGIRSRLWEIIPKVVDLLHN